MFTKAFMLDVAERALKTFVQSLGAILTAGATGILEVDWVNALSVSALATLVSALTSIGSGRVGDSSASLAKIKEDNVGI